MAYNSLQEFVQVLEKHGELERITYPGGRSWRSPRSVIGVMKSSGPAVRLKPGVIPHARPSLFPDSGVPRSDRRLFLRFFRVWPRGLISAGSGALLSAGPALRLCWYGAAIPLRVWITLPS